MMLSGKEIIACFLVVFINFCISSGQIVGRPFGYALLNYLMNTLGVQWQHKFVLSVSK